MKVWCSVHDSKQWQADLRPEYAVVGECERFVIHRLVLGFDHEVPCVFDEMQLVPADALVMPTNISWLHPEHRNPDWPPPGPDDGLPGSGQVRLIVVPYTWDGQQWVESFEMPAEEPPKDPWDYDP